MGAFGGPAVGKSVVMSRVTHPLAGGGSPLWITRAVERGSHTDSPDATPGFSTAVECELLFVMHYHKKLYGVYAIAGPDSANALLLVLLSFFLKGNQRPEAASRGAGSGGRNSCLRDRSAVEVKPQPGFPNPA